MRPSRYVVAFALAALVGAPRIACADASPAAESVVPSVLTGPQPGDPAPGFAVTSIDGKPIRLADFRGKTLVVNVWATWCPPCRLEMPDLIAAAPKYAKGGDVAFLGIDSTEDAPIVKAYAAAKGVPYALAIDGDKSFEKAYDIQGFPTTYVIDGSGIVRARYVDVLGTRQLAELIDAGKAGRNATIVSPLQSKIDATLAAATGAFAATDPAALDGAAVAASKAIAAAEALLDQSDAASGNSTDYSRTRVEEAALRGRAIVALEGLGSAAKDPTLLPLLRADAASDAERWSDALAGYRSVTAIDPKNEDALGGISTAAYHLDQYDVEVDADSRLSELEPDDVTAFVSLAIAQAKAGKNADSYASFDRAIAIAQRHVRAKPSDPAAMRSLAYAYLYAGRTYAKNGDAVRARADFDAMLVATQKLPLHDKRHDMYLEEGQEAIAAIGLTAPKGLSVSLAPWTGAELPGSIPNTIKYRLVLAGVAGRNVTLSASNVPKTWVASFCSDKVCAPMRVGVAIPASGVKIVEFQLVPPGTGDTAPKVRVTGTDGTANATAST